MKVDVLEQTYRDVYFHRLFENAILSVELVFPVSCPDLHGAETIDIDHVFKSPLFQFRPKEGVQFDPTIT